MRPQKTATVIGHFGFGFEYCDGQTVKTKILTAELERRFGEAEIRKVDTHGGWRSLLKAPFRAFRAVRTSRNVVMLPANNGLRVYAPLLAFARHFHKRTKLHYAVIGGWLPSFLAGRKRLAKTLRQFDGIYVETATMQSALTSMGFTNVVVMPNCKELRILDEAELPVAAEPPFRLCTFSRVMREKGIEDAVDAVKAVNARAEQTLFTLDIYGQIDAGQTEWFAALRESFPDFVRYGGVVPFNKSTEVLKDYFALLFPTYYEGEGFAGTLIDALAAGVPVIASNWKYNPELIGDGKTGRLFPTHDTAALTALLTAAAEDPAAWNEMKVNCTRRAADFLPANALGVLTDRLI